VRCGYGVHSHSGPPRDNLNPRNSHNRPFRSRSGGYARLDRLLSLLGRRFGQALDLAASARALVSPERQHAHASRYGIDLTGNRPSVLLLNRGKPALCSTLRPRSTWESLRARYPSLAGVSSEVARTAYELIKPAERSEMRTAAHISPAHHRSRRPANQPVPLIPGYFDHRTTRYR
jgi:hypothetical protein